VWRLQCCGCGRMSPARLYLQPLRKSARMMWGGGGLPGHMSRKFVRKIITYTFRSTYGQSFKGK